MKSVAEHCRLILKFLKVFSLIAFTRKVIANMTIRPFDDIQSSHLHVSNALFVFALEVIVGKQNKKSNNRSNSRCNLLTSNNKLTYPTLKMVGNIQHNGTRVLIYRKIRYNANKLLYHSIFTPERELFYKFLSYEILKLFFLNGVYLPF